MQSNRTSLIILALIGLVLAALFLSLSYSRPFFDEGIYITAGWLNSMGKVPYNDFFLMKPAGIVFVLSTWFSFFGATVFNARVLSLLVSLATLLGVFLLAKKLFGEKAALLSSLFFALWLVPFSAYFAIIDPFLALTAVWSALFLFICVEERTLEKSFVFGFFLGASLIFKQTMVVFALGLIAIALFLHPKGKPRSLANIASFAAGFLLLPVLFLLYLVNVNALANFLEAVLFPIAGQQSFLVFTLDERLALPFLAFSFVPVALIALYKNYLGAAEKKKEIAIISLLFVFTLANAFPFRGCCIHAIPALPFASILVGFVAVEAIKRREKVFSAVSVALIAGSFLVLVFSYGYFASPEFSFIAVDSIAEYISGSTMPGDKILVMPASPELYFLSKRGPASRQLYFFGSYNEAFQQKAIGEISASNPKIVVYLAKEKEDFYAGPELVDAYIQENYSVREELELYPPLYKFYNYAIILELKE